VADFLGWTAPSAIGTAGVGFGGQIGAEVTDYVIILNTADAVKAFSHGGNVTLGVR
jgi:lipid-binding SYLF domain-containing protein